MLEAAICEFVGVAVIDKYIGPCAAGFQVHEATKLGKVPVVEILRHPGIGDFLE